MFEIITIDELLLRLNKYNHKELHVHHTWSPSKKDFNGSNGITLQNSMKSYHLSLGWSDIGQHVTLLPDGKFVTGRPFDQAPASIAGYNTGGFAMEMLGNFDLGHDVFENPQKASALRLAKYFIDKGRYVRFHRENSPKTCPGTGIDKAVFMAEAQGVVIKVVTSSPVTPATAKADSMTLYIQKTLNRLKIADAPLTEDGISGTKTKAAIVKFQDIVNITRDGVPGIVTQNAFNDILLKPVMSIGNYNRNATRYLQYRLGLIKDGIYGNTTAAWVKSYQVKNGLIADSICGKNTWGKLIS